MSASQSPDPRRDEVIRALQALHVRLQRKLIIRDYRAYRDGLPEDERQKLPTTTTIYRLFDTWPDALRAAGIHDGASDDETETRTEKLREHLRFVAEQLGTSELSSHTYDRFRRDYNARALPGQQLKSSSVIRKWLGHWPEAVKSAGLSSTQRRASRPVSRAEILDALRLAKRQVAGVLTSESYREWRDGLNGDDRQRVPDVDTILSQYHGDWQHALKAAGVEQSDTLHPKALWTADEARRIHARLQTVLGHPPTREEYTAIRERSRKPLPTWRVLQDLLSL